MKWQSLLLIVLLFFPHTFFVTYAQENSGSYLMPPVLKGELIVNQVHLTWTPNRDVGFKRYYLVRTQQNNLPLYPEEDAIWSTEDRSNAKYQETLSFKDGFDHYYRVCVVNTANRISCSNIIQVLPNRVVKSYNFYKDVLRDSWYEPYVIKLFRREIIYPQQSGRFNPTGNVTRGELAQMIVAALIERGTYKSSFPPAPFCDVGRFHAQAVYINHAFEMGIAEGAGDKLCANGKAYFYPDRPVTRAEAVKMILLAFDYSPDGNVANDETSSYDNRDLFLDVHQSDWFAAFVYRAKTEAIISGYPDDTFRPNASVNRVEMAKILSLAFRY